jgi:hypothetical protein
MTSTREGRVTSRQTGADDAGLTTRSRSIQVGEFEVAIPGGIWVAIGENVDCAAPVLCEAEPTRARACSIVTVVGRPKVSAIDITHLNPTSEFRKCPL